MLRAIGAGLAADPWRSLVIIRRHQFRFEGAFRHQNGCDANRQTGTEAGGGAGCVAHEADDEAEVFADDSKIGCAQDGRKADGCKKDISGKKDNTTRQNAT